MGVGEMGQIIGEMEVGETGTDRFVVPDLGPKCLPWLSADDTGSQRVKCP